MESGGRLTQNTNDLTLAFLRARRDLGCRYTLGVYDRRPNTYRSREIDVSVLRPGLRVIHASGYSFRSPEEKRRSRLMAAWMTPAMFPGGVVRIHAFPIRPKTPKLWETQLVVTFPLSAMTERGASATYAFGATLRQGGRILHRFSREFRLRSRSEAPLPERQATFLQTTDVAPGAYEATAVLTDPSGEKVFAATVRVELPEIVKGEAILSGPILGRPAAGNVVVRSATTRAKGRTTDDPAKDEIGTSRSFQPYLVAELEPALPAAALTVTCLVSGGHGARPVVVDRRLVRADGVPAGTLEPARLEWNGENRVRCETLLDIVPIPDLADGSYRLDATLDPAPRESRGAGSARFAVKRSSDAR